MVLFVFQFYPACHFGKFSNYSTDIFRSGRVNTEVNFWGVADEARVVTEYQYIIQV